MLCFLYILALSSTFAVAAALFDYGAPRRIPRRWMWMTAIVLSIVLPPLFYLTRRRAFNVEVLSSPLVSFSSGHITHLPRQSMHGGPRP